MDDDEIKIEICITDFVKDAVDDSAFAINFQVNGPGSKTDYLRVSFSELFLEEYFQIKFPQDLAEEENKIIETKRNLFVKWGICKIEQWINRGRKEDNLLLSGTEDQIWAKKVESGAIQPKSEARNERTYLYVKRF